jgi:arylsulfatase A-like enzyme
LLDIYPTLTDLCDLTPPSNLAGKSLRPLLNNPAAAWNKPAFSQVWRNGFAGYSVRTERWRYTQWDTNGSKGEELHDYVSDPGELRNLAGDPKNAATVAELKALVQKNWAQPYLPPANGQKGKAKKG